MDKQDKKHLLATYKERTVTGGVYGIRCMETGKLLLFSTTDLQGSKNRFTFSQSMDTCTFLKLQEDWKKLGGKAFAFELLEELERKETQTDREFAEDISTLEELWREKLMESELY